MLKLMGIFIIACGIAGAVGAWCDNYRRKIDNIKAMIELLNRAVYVLVKEKRKVIYFFNIMSEGKTDIAAICGDMAKVLESHICATGEEAWRRCVSERKNELCMDKMQLELMYRAGEVFFAKTGLQMNRDLKIIREQFNENLRGEQLKLKEQKKIVMPLSAFGGILLMIILV